MVVTVFKYTKDSLKLHYHNSRGVNPSLTGEEKTNSSPTRVADRADGSELSQSKTCKRQLEAVAYKFNISCIDVFHILKVRKVMTSRK